MVDLFFNKVLVKNNKDRDELDTEREIIVRLQNRILVLLFGSGDCARCRNFAPTLKHFITKLTDEFYVDRSVQLALLYISLDRTEEQQDEFLHELPKRCLFLPFQDPYRNELKLMFQVEDVPTVVVLRPDCSVLCPNAVMEIRSHGTDCFQNWREAAELIDRNFLMNEEYDESASRSVTDVIRRLKYRVEKKKKKQDGEEDEGGVWG